MDFIFSLLFLIGLFWLITVFLFVAFYLPIVKIYKTQTNSNVITKKLKIIILSFCTILSLGTSVFIAYSYIENRTGYWNDPGFADYYRVPLEYPYQLSMVDAPYEAILDIWNDTNSVSVVNPDIYGIDSLNIVNNIVFVKLDRNNIYYTNGKVENKKWFILDCTTGKINYYTSEAILKTHLDSLSIDSSISLISVNDYYNEYWDEH